MAQPNPGSSPARTLDVITIGRSSVDLYGQQIGSRLEDIASFAKSVGGCPSNIAIGTARLGLKSGSDHPRRRRADGALHPRAGRPRGRRHAGHRHRQGATDGAGAACGRGRGRLADDLLPLGLRRHGTFAKRISTRRSSARRTRFSSRARIFPSRTPRPRSARRSASPRRMAARSFSTSTTGRTSGDLPATPKVSSVT